MKYELIKVSSETDRHAYHSIREGVLWKARGRSGYDSNRPEEHNPNNYPLLFKLEGNPIGTTRLDNSLNGTGIVRLVAITKKFQRQGHGWKLSELWENYARQLGIHTLFVNADPDAVAYYRKLGWQLYSWDVNELQGIASDCIQMKKVLSQN